VYRHADLYGDKHVYKYAHKDKHPDNIAYMDQRLRLADKYADSYAFGDSDEHRVPGTEFNIYGDTDKNNYFCKYGDIYADQLAFAYFDKFGSPFGFGEPFGYAGRYCHKHAGQYFYLYPDQH